MDFARKQLEKYGWTDGKGLGRHENGISEALKPKLKRSAAGIGHDAASEFNEHWWTTLYDKAVGNVEVQNKNGKTKKIKTKNAFQITNSTWKLKQKPKEEENDKQYSAYFVRTAVLTNGGSKVEKVKESESESEEEKKDVFKMTDEELFKICEGRTAHKGARHGLKATGKLARIAEQEALLLTEPRFSGYSHAKKLTKNKVAEESNFDIDSEVPKSKKKKKRKYCHSNEKLRENSLAKAHELPMSVNDVKQHDDVISVIKENRVNKKSKYENKKSFSCHEVEEEIVEIVKTTELEKKITKKRNTHIQQQKNDSKVKRKKEMNFL